MKRIVKVVIPYLAVVILASGACFAAERPGPSTGGGNPALPVQPPYADPFQDVFRQWLREPAKVERAVAAEAKRMGGLVLCVPIRNEEDERSSEEELSGAIASAVLTLRRLGVAGSLRVVGGVIVGLLYPTEMGDSGLYPADADGCCPEGTMPVASEPPPGRRRTGG